MKRKLIIFSILSAATLLTLKYTNQTLINNEIELLTNIANEEISNITSNKKSITIANIPLTEHFIDDYNVTILSIDGTHRILEDRNNEEYVTFMCRVNFSYLLDSIKYTESIDTQILFINKNDTWVILSTDDLKKDILKCIADNSNLNDNKVAEINYLIYESNSLDISFNYPSSLTYSSTKGKSEDEGLYETVTLIDSDTEKNYIKIYIQEKPINLNDKIFEFTSKGYKIVSEHETIGDIEFIKLENSFSQDGKTNTETIYLCKEKFDTAQFISITTNEDQLFQKDIQIIINSLKK